MDTILALRAQVKQEIKLWKKLKEFQDDVYGEVEEVILDKLLYLEKLYLSI